MTNVPHTQPAHREADVEELIERLTSIMRGRPLTEAGISPSHQIDRQ